MKEKLFHKTNHFKTKKIFEVEKILNSDLSIQQNVNNLESWLFYDYLRHYDSLTELKYKGIILGIFLSINKIKLKTMPSIEQMIDELSNKVERDSKFNLNNFFGSSLGLIDKN